MSSEATSALGGETEFAQEEASTQTESMGTEGSQESGFQMPEWMSGFEVEQDIAADPALKPIKDVPSLVKSFVHSQRKMGADKTVLPNKNSTKEEWLQLYQKLGLPSEFDEYSFEKPEGASFDEHFDKSFRERAYENNLLPDQAQAMYEFITNETQGRMSAAQEEQANQAEAALNALKQEWGDAFDRELGVAKLAVKEFGGDDFINYLNESGLGDNPNLIKVFSNIGKQYFKEDTFKTESKPAYGLSPQEASEKIKAIQTNYDGPYYNKAHPEHNKIVNEMSKLFEVIENAKKQA